MTDYSDLKSLYAPTIHSEDPASCCVGHKYQGYCAGKENGPDSVECGVLMSKRCGNLWDEWCEVYSRDRGGSDYSDFEIDLGKRLSTGEKFIRDTVVHKYCDMVDDGKCNKSCYPFSPRDPDSPEVCEYNGECDFRCRVPTSAELKEDKALDKCLDNPEACFDILQGMCKNSVESGSKLDDYCKSTVENNHLPVTMADNSVDSVSKSVQETTCKYVHNEWIILLIICILVLVLIPCCRK